MKWLTNSEYYHSVWSAEYKYDGLGLGENRHSNIVTFGNSGTFEIEDELRNKGLGSYMLDSIIVWAKKTILMLLLKFLSVLLMILSKIRKTRSFLWY